MKKRWLIITTYWLNEAEMDCMALDYAKDIEKAARAHALYFCRYSDYHDGKMNCRTIIRLETRASISSIQKVWSGKLYVGEVKVEDIGPCSPAHAAAFPVAKIIGDAREPQRGELLMDVTHWLCNMCSLNYWQEMEFYTRLLTHFVKSKAKVEADWKAKLLEADKHPHFTDD